MVEEKEHRLVFLAMAVILGITFTPYLTGFVLQGTDWRFTGFLFGVEDGNSYIAKMLSGTYGNWLFRSPYSTMPQTGVLAFFPYILLGKLAYPPGLHEQLVALFQIFRLVSGGLLIWATYSFVAVFIHKPEIRLLTSLVILTGGGLGWFGWMLIPDDGTWRLPLEAYSPEAFGLLSIIGLPHLAAARAFLLMGLTGFLKLSTTQFKFSSVLVFGLYWFIAGFFQPLILAVGCAILAVYALFVWIFSGSLKNERPMPYIKNTFVMAICASPWILYNLFFFSSDGYLKIWYSQNIISSPPLYDYLWSFGIYLIAAVPAVKHIFKQKDNRAIILPVWILCAAVLAYIPYNLQRRFIDGVWVAIVILIFMNYEIIANRKWKVTYKAIIASTFISPILVMMTLTFGILKIAKPVYRPEAEVKMFESLSKMVEPGDTVLSSYDTGNALPAWVPVYVLAGHGPESANLKYVLSEIESFYSGDIMDESHEEFLTRNSVDFIIWGPGEIQNNATEIKFDEQFQSVYDNDSYKVFQVTTEKNE